MSTSAPDRSDLPSRSIGLSPVPIVLLIAMAAGVLYRLFPLVAGERALARFFITEDGYLMLTVARNLGLGNGLSVSDGTIATNGVQPLATFLFAVPYWLTDGDKLTGLIGVVLISTLVATAAALGIYAFARAVLRSQDQSRIWPGLVTTLWFLGPLLLLDTMNALETGLYTLMVVTVVWYFGRLTGRSAGITLTEQIALGSLFGLMFLARNDGVFLVAALLLVRFVDGWMSGRATFLRAIGEAAVPGLVSLLWAAPWLVYNYRLFGSIVPISGISESLDAAFGVNAPLVPVKLFEGMFPMLPVPSHFETATPLSVAAGSIVLAVLARFLWLQRRSPMRLAVFGYALFGVLIVGYYGFLFGASWFLARYFAPLAPLLITAAASVALDLGPRLMPRRGKTVVQGAGLAGVALSAALLGRLLLPGVHQHEHFQVVEWVQDHVPDETWMGAVQTGTLGYWHDRTINLDGKVNPAALRARIETGNVLSYIVGSDITCLADWAGIASWATLKEGGFRDAFALVLDDPERNLAVLCRRGAGIGAS